MSLNFKREYMNRDKKQLQIIETLVLMGYNLEMIEMCFCFFTIKSVEQAVHLMSKESEIWQHDYIISESNLCIICNEYSDHKNFITEKEKKLEKLKELNDSFNSKFRSSIEHLRESKANRQSNDSKSSSIRLLNDNKNANIFEINSNFSNDDKINNSRNAAKQNQEQKNDDNNNNDDNYTRINNNKFVFFPSKDRNGLKNENQNSTNFDKSNFNENKKSLDDYDFDSIDENTYIKLPLQNSERRKLKKFDIRDKIQVLDVGEAQNKIIKDPTEQDIIDNADLLLTGIFEFSLEKFLLFSEQILNNRIYLLIVFLINKNSFYNKYKKYLIT